METKSKSNFENESFLFQILYKYVKGSLQKKEMEKIKKTLNKKDCVQRVIKSFQLANRNLQDKNYLIQFLKEELPKAESIFIAKEAKVNPDLKANLAVYKNEIIPLAKNSVPFIKLFQFVKGALSKKENIELQQQLYRNTELNDAVEAMGKAYLHIYDEAYLKNFLEGRLSFFEVFFLKNELKLNQKLKQLINRLERTTLCHLDLAFQNKDLKKVVDVLYKYLKDKATENEQRYIEFRWQIDEDFKMLLDRLRICQKNLDQADEEFLLSFLYHELSPEENLFIYQELKQNKQLHLLYEQLKTTDFTTFKEILFEPSKLYSQPYILRKYVSFSLPKEHRAHIEKMIENDAILKQIVEGIELSITKNNINAFIEERKRTCKQHILQKHSKPRSFIERLMLAVRNRQSRGINKVESTIEKLRKNKENTGIQGGESRSPIRHSIRQLPDLNIISSENMLAFQGGLSNTQFESRQK